MKTITELSNKEKATLHKLAHSARFFKSDFDNATVNNSHISQGLKTDKTRTENKLKKFATENDLPINDDLFNYKWGN